MQRIIRDTKAFRLRTPVISLSAVLIRRTIFRSLLLVVFLVGLFLGPGMAAELPHLRVGALAKGSVRWEMTILKKLGLDTKYQFVLDVVPYAGKSATEVALQGGAVDVIVDDWFWVARQRSQGVLLTAFPYSQTVGGVVVPKDSPIQDLPDLQGKKIGLAGGPLDKSWLILRAVYLQRYGSDLQDLTETVSVAPPLASVQLERGELDAIVQFWHFIARLLAKGKTRQLVSVDALMRELGLSETVPLLVYVFPEKLVRQNRQLVQNFIHAVYEAKQYLLDHDEAWKEIADLVRAPDEKTLILIREAWRKGVPRRWDAETFANLERLFHIMRRIGGKRLIGTEQIPEGTFLKEISF
ncbi:MAG: ABC transporter substrate-binding protein [Nitrospinota bacterium]|nr:MAG: ABC transporter substrate-binding protein [Nitrospinota bacterium]